MSQSEKFIYLMRHGEIATPGILAGKTDVTLSEFGRRQLWQSAESLSAIQQCISSPLQRCALWAKEFADKNELPLQIEPNIQEMNFGDWDGKPYQSLWESKSNPDDPKNESINIGDFWQNPWQITPPNGESMQAFSERVDSWWQHFALSNQQGNTLVVAHGGVIKYLVAKFMGIPINNGNYLGNINIGYASVIKLSLFIDEHDKVWTRVHL